MLALTLTPAILAGIWGMPCETQTLSWECGEICQLASHESGALELGGGGWGSDSQCH